MVVAEVIEIQIDFYLVRRLLYPHEPSQFQDHCHISAALRFRVALFALFCLFDLRDINNRDCSYLFFVEESYQKTRIKQFGKGKG